MVKDSNTRSRAVFLDRDGTLIIDKHYLRDPEMIEILPGVVEGLRSLQESGWALIMVSNQSGVARGLMSIEDVDRVNRQLLSMLQQDEVNITGLYVCPHGPDEGCECRKPKPGMLIDAAKVHFIDLNESWMIGDRESDISAGRRAGTRTVLLNDDGLQIDSKEVGSDRVVGTFSDAVSVILESGK